MTIRQTRARRTIARTIASESDLATVLRALKRSCPHMQRAHAAAGDPPLRRWSSGFDGLARIVIAQQLSTASAAAIAGRLKIAVDPLDAVNLMAADDETLRSAGLSAGKIATLRAVANAVQTGQLDFDALMIAPEQVVREQLTALRGIGPWTADIYMLFCQGHSDAFAPGDLALQIAVQMLLELPTRPTPAELEAIAERWRPWRGGAARLLWAYYGAAKAGPGSKTC